MLKLTDQLSNMHNRIPLNRHTMMGIMTCYRIICPLDTQRCHQREQLDWIHWSSPNQQIRCRMTTYARHNIRVASQMFGNQAAQHQVTHRLYGSVTQQNLLPKRTLRIRGIRALNKAASLQEEPFQNKDQGLSSLSWDNVIPKIQPLLNIQMVPIQMWESALLDRFRK